MKTLSQFLRIYKILLSILWSNTFIISYISCFRLKKLNRLLRVGHKMVVIRKILLLHPKFAKKAIEFFVCVFCRYNNRRKLGIYVQGVASFIQTNFQNSVCSIGGMIAESFMAPLCAHIYPLT